MTTTCNLWVAGVHACISHVWTHTLADLSSECPAPIGPVQGISGSVSEIAGQPLKLAKVA